MRTVAKVLVCVVLAAMLVFPGISPVLGEEPRMGAWVDEVIITVEPDRWQAVDRLALDDLDVYAVSMTDSSLYAAVLANPDIGHVISVGSYNEFTCNPVPFFADGTFNPLGFPRIREALNWLVDRDYFAADIQCGMAKPKYTCLGGHCVDARDRYPHLMADIEYHYGYHLGHAANVIEAEMLALDAYLHDGNWHYDGTPVQIRFLIRTEDSRLEMGDYLSAHLEALGFQVTRTYGMMDDLSPLWLESDPAQGLWNVYTGGWMTTTVQRDQGGNFALFYTDTGYSSPLWQAYDPDPEFYDVSRKLDHKDFTTLQQREALFEQALWMSMEDSARIWLVDNEGFSPLRSNVRLAADRAGGIPGSHMWGHTVHLHDGGVPLPGGTLRVAMPSGISATANPVAGSNWLYDMFWIRATGDNGLAVDTRDGLRWPHRFERAEVIVQSGLPVGVTHDWCSLASRPAGHADLTAPADAWADWDAVTQRFVTVGEKMDPGSPYYDEHYSPAGRLKSVVYYPQDIFEIPLHDGSTLSMGDFVLYAILQLDRADPQSAIYDPTAHRNFGRALRLIADDPDYGLIVETYTDKWWLDAEYCAVHWFPYYAQGPGMWHTIALGIMAEADGELAFSSVKAGDLGVEWTSFIAGPSIDILQSYLNAALATAYPDNLPYAPTLADYITEAEAAQRYANLSAWSDPVTGPGHFWVAGGPLYLQEADPVEGTVHLRRFEDYPDPADRWLFLLSPLEEPAEDWLVNLTLTTAPNIGTVPGPGYTFAFGAQDGATEGYSADEGDVIAPPPPMEGVEAYFRYPENPAGQINLVTSVVGPDATIIWPLRVRSVGDPADTQATLTWDAGDLINVPAKYVTLELRDTAGTTLADMRSVASYSFSLEAGQIRNFHVVAAEHTPPQVSSVQVEQRTDGSGMVDVTYDVFDNEEGTVYIGLEYWNGSAWSFAFGVSGDAGPGVETGEGRHAVWDARAQVGEVYIPAAKIRISAQSTGGRNEAESNVFDLDTAPPTGYGPNSPASGATGVCVEPELASSVASDNSGPVQYRFMIARDSGFTVGAQESAWQIATDWTPPAVLEHGTPYLWKVKARDAMGNEGQWSAASTFTTISQTIYEFKAGWNMVSLPVQTAETSPQDLFPGHEAIYTWDPDLLSYAVPAEIVVGRGYWVLYFEDVTVPVDGVPVEQYEIEWTVAGWHMIGSLYVNAQVTATAGDVYGQFYWWNPESLSYEAMDTLKPGRGYWLLGFTDFGYRVEPRPPSPP